MTPTTKSSELFPGKTKPRDMTFQQLRSTGSLRQRIIEDKRKRPDRKKKHKNFFGD